MNLHVSFRLEQNYQLDKSPEIDAEIASFQAFQAERPSKIEIST